MTREELWKLWFPRMYKGEPAEAEKIKAQFFEDLSKWFDSELKSNTAEMQKAIKDKTIRRQFIRLIWKLLRGQSLESIEKEFEGEHD